MMLLIFMSSNTKAQTFQITDTLIMHDDNMVSSVLVSVDPEVKTLKNAWQDYIKSNYDFKLRGRGVLSAEEVKVQQISSNYLNFYTMIEESDYGATMKVFASKGYDIQITPNEFPEEYKAIRDIVENFLKQNLPNYYHEMVKDTEERIQELNKDKSNIESDLADERNKLEALKVEIKEREEELLKQEEKLGEAKTKLEMRLEKLERIRNELREL